jgi:hypothetical protein
MRCCTPVNRDVRAITFARADVALAMQSRTHPGILRECRGLNLFRRGTRDIVAVARTTARRRRFPMRTFRAILVSAAVLAVASCAQPVARDPAGTASPAPKSRATADDYRRYFRGHVTSFRASGLTDWDAPDPNHVVVWVSPLEAYFLTLYGACFGLEHATTILLSADGGVMRPGGGAIMVGSERCSVQGVEKLDARAMKADGVH